MGRPKKSDLRPATARRWLIAITILSAALCFARLSYPPALTDEAFTFWRICGSFSQLFDTLRLDAFMPLHYEVVWLTTRVFGFEVWSMRLPSAMAGTCLPFAVFLLTRVLAGRRAGVIAALLTASSAFLNYFSRNAKMYADAWLMLTLAVAFLLIYARTGRRLAALLFILFGVAAAGFYAVAAGVLATSPVLALAAASRRRFRRMLVALIGTALIAGVPAAYYQCGNQWFSVSGGLSHGSERGMADHDNGLMWIGGWQAGRDASNTLVSCLSSYLFAYEWPPADANGPSWLSGDWLLRSVGWGLISVAVVVAAAACVSIIRPGEGRRRAMLLYFITCIVVLPMYAIALRSFEPVTPPWDLAEPFGALPLVAVLAFAIWRWRAWLPALGIACLCAATWAAIDWAHAHQQQLGIAGWNNLWMPRYTGYATPFLFALIAMAICKLPTWPLRALVIAAVVGSNLAMVIARLTLVTEWPGPQYAADQVRTIRQADWLMCVNWINRPNGVGVPSLPGPFYHLVMAADIDVDPPGFRDGVSWPYRPGSAVKALLAQIRTQPGDGADTLIAASIQHLAVWRRLPKDDQPPPSIPGFALVSRAAYHDHYTWTWDAGWVRERLEYARR